MPFFFLVVQSITPLIFMSFNILTRVLKPNNITGCSWWRKFRFKNSLPNTWYIEGKKNELLTFAKEYKLTYHQYEINWIFDKEWIQVRLWVTFTKIILLKTSFFFNNNSLLNPLWNKFLFYNHFFKVIFFFSKYRGS